MTATGLPLEAKIRRQLEYYFGDFNLMRDDFLKNEIKLSNEAKKDGFVSIDIMLKCNRLSQLTTDTAKIAKSCAGSKLLELNEDKTGVRRNPERKLPVDDEIYRVSLKNRTCYVSGLPRDENGKGEIEPATIDEIYDFMESLDLEVETVNLRRNRNPKDATHMLFNGSIFVTFASQSDASKFLESDKKFKDTHELTKMTKQAYWAMENTRKKTLKAGGDVEAAVKSAKAKLEEEKAPKYTEGIIVCFEGVKDATIRREDIKDFLVESGGAVDFIDFESGKDSGKILLNLEHGKKPAEIFGENFTPNIKGDDITFSVGTEKDYEVASCSYTAFKKQMAEKKRQPKNFKKKNNKFGKRQRPNGRQNTKKTFDSDDEAIGSVDNSVDKAPVDNGEQTEVVQNGSSTVAESSEPAAKVAKVE